MKRPKQREYKSLTNGKHWCDRCDRALTSGYTKCPICGYREKPFNIAVRRAKEKSEIQDV